MKHGITGSLNEHIDTEIFKRRKEIEALQNQLAIEEFENTEEERLSNLKTEAVEESVATTVDRPIVEEASEPVRAEGDGAFNLYMSELKKY